MIHIHSTTHNIYHLYYTYNNNDTTKKTEEVLTELKHNSKVKFKETDLFRVYQSIDLVSYKNEKIQLFLCIHTWYEF